MTDKELLTTLIQQYSDLLNIKNASDMKKEVERQLIIIKAKLEAMGFSTENLEK